MSAAALAVVVVILAGAVILGVALEHRGVLEERAKHDVDEEDRHRQLMRELRRHDDEQVRWRP